MLGIGLISAFYALTFVFGISGNLWVVTALYRARKDFQLLCFNTSRPVTTPPTASDRLRTFIFVLAITDCVVLMTLPVSTVHVLNGSWPFGQIGCALYIGTDRGAKLFSVAVLTGMALQRYLVICTSWRSASKAFWIPIIIGVTTCVIIPVIWETIYSSVVNFRNEVNSTSLICVSLMEKPEEKYFVNYTFFCGFAIPVITMTFCYVMILKHVRNKYRESRAYGTTKNRKPQYMCGLTTSIWRISIFHFGCWAPFWFFTAAPYIVRLFHLPEFQTNTTWFMTGHLLSNILPYINSAGNWILYAFLNYDIRELVLRRRKHKTSSGGFIPITVSYRQTVDTTSTSIFDH
uniref:G-protein coupled receptors family 1 profile domain-containing protein n=1 Tax=Panagrolaimus sp. JU765 TaxID=591449 RepID=A0AC34RA83_9BILA